MNNVEQELNDNNSNGYIEFTPALSSKYSKKLITIASRILNVLAAKRSEIINQEISAEKSRLVDESEKVDLLKYISSLSILRDLLMQEWDIYLDSNKIYLRFLEDKFDNKDAIRFRLEAEKRAQFEYESNKAFIKKMEKERKFRGNTVSIKCLIGDPELLINRILQYREQNPEENSCKGIEDIVKPYIQVVDGSRDEHTGYKLNEIWRYFRYTWSIPYKSTPGRNLFYLIRDASQPFDPIVGICALGNCVLNLNIRDFNIGWTVESIKRNLNRKEKTETYSVMVNENRDNTRTVEKPIYLETEEEYEARIETYSRVTINSLNKFVDIAISEIYTADLVTTREKNRPTIEVVNRLNKKALELRDRQFDIKKSEGQVKWKEEAKSVLFTKKRALELAKLLETKIKLNENREVDYLQQLRALLATEAGRKCIGVALIANRKRKIGSNMMEIIVCGAIPPYNDLLAGKLVSLLCCSPQVIIDYEEKYTNQVSEIASRMKGKRVIRDSTLAFLGTTSLYSICSSQYNRIKVPIDKEFYLDFKELGKTEGYGSVFFSKETTTNINSMLELIEGGRKINNVFGEGTSPRFRLISRGLGMLGINSTEFLKHYSPRIVYAVYLAKNSKEFLMGHEDELKHYFERHNENQVKEMTQFLIDYWERRWLSKRVKNYEVDIIRRLRGFRKEHVFVSNHF